MKIKLISFIACCFLFLNLSNIDSQVVRYAEVRNHNGKPCLFVNDTVVTPDFYALTHAYGGRWSWEEVPSRNISNFCKLGFRLYQADIYLEDIWHENCDSLDISKVQKQVKGITDICPEAGVVIRIHVNAPYWWNRKHRDECSEFADGPVEDRAYGPPFNNEDGDIDRPLRASLASMKWREEAGSKLKEFCHRLALTTEGNSVIGLHISGGVYGEWHYWGFIEHDPDTGPAMTGYFRAWLKAKYKTDEALKSAWNNNKFKLENASVPGMEERNFTSDGIFRDPAKEKRVVDYYTCQQEVVADDIEYFCRTAKENWPRKLVVGVFYGYFHMTFCRQASGGHLCIERILKSPWIDYLSAPQTYWSASREAGGSGNSRGVIESAMIHGKLWLDEMDNGFLQKSSSIDDIRVSTQPDTSYMSVLRRSAIYPLMRGNGLWYYDFGLQKSFGWWDRPAYLKNIKEEKDFFDKKEKSSFHSDADLLYVWDMETFYYLANGWTPVCYNQLDEAFEEALRSGSSADHIYLFDLDKINPVQYKAVIFMNVYRMSDKQRDFIKKKIASSGRTLIWNYMPGYTNGEKLSLDFVEANVGMKIKRILMNTKPVVAFTNPALNFGFESAVNPLVIITDPSVEKLAFLTGTDSVIVARKKYPEYTSVYSSLPLHRTEIFRKLFKEAGCHIYNDNNDFTYVRSGMLMVHTKAGGFRTLHLKGGKDIAVTLTPNSTTLFDGNSGVVLIK